MDKETITLLRTVAYKVYITTSEFSGKVMGYYSDYQVAVLDAKGAGWYGSDGTVTKIDVFIDGEGYLYDLTSLGKFADVEKTFREVMRTRILAKLTPEEINFLALNDQNK